MLGVSFLTTGAVVASTVAFVAWLCGMAALLVVSRRDLDARRPRLAARLDRSIWVLWIGSTAVMFGPAFGFAIAALTVGE